MNIVRFCRKQSRAVYLVTGLLVVAGLFSLFRLPSAIYPELTFPRIVIIVRSGDLSPQSMLLTVTRPIEEGARTVLGVWRVRSHTIRGGADISVYFNPDMDMRYALQLVDAEVSDVRSELPASTEITVKRITPSAWPILMMVLTGNVPSADLRDYAYYVLRPMFNRVQGVSMVDVEASYTREVSVIVDPQKALAHHLSLPEIADRLRATNNVTSVGRLDKDYSRYLVLATGRYRSLSDIRNTVVAIENQDPIRLADIATVRYGTNDPVRLVYGNGQPAALISVARQIGGNILQVAGQVKDMAKHLGSALPSTLHLTAVYDMAEFVREAIASIRDAVVIGCLLAVIILFGFLRDGRTTAIAALTLPITVISTFFFAYLFNQTLNLMSLGGLAIAIGLIIDDAVVIIENIYRHLGLGESAAEAAENGTRELLGAVLSSTATTVVVFSPLSLLSGVVGEFFTALCVTLASAVLLSLLFAITLIPLLSERFLAQRRHQEASSRLIEPVYRGYERAVRWSLGHRWLVVAATCLSVVLTCFLYNHVGSGFLPEMDEGGFVLDHWTPPGTSLPETERLSRLVEDQVRNTPEVAAVMRRIGARMGPVAPTQNRGEMLAKLVPRSQRKRGIDEIMNELRGRIHRNVPGIEVEFTQVLQDSLGDMEGNPEPVEVKLFGNNMAQLTDLADVVGRKMQHVPGLVDFKGIQKQNPEIQMRIDPVAAGRVGLTMDQVSQQLDAGLLGTIRTELQETDRTIPIRVRFPDSFRYNYSDVRQFPIITTGHQIVPVSSLATIKETPREDELLREDGRLMVDLTGRLENRDLGSVVRDVKSALNTVKFPVGTSYEIGGQYESQQQSFHDLISILCLALAAVFIVLVIQFRAFLPSLIIMSAAPLSILGVFAMLVATGTALNVSSFMGIILMVGLVVKNGIILFEYVHKLREERGLPLAEALVQAGKIRLRPILMTTLCTLFGLLPLALGLGAGAELQKPLALAVIGGLSLSTLITLLVMPVLYSLTDRSRASSPQLVGSEELK